MTEYSYNEIKKELQGDHGLIKKIKKNHIPDTVKMALFAQEKFEKEINSFDNIDFVLNELLVIEYDIYLQREKQINDNFIEYVDAEANDKEFPALRNEIDKYKILAQESDNPTSILRGITKIIVFLADSNRQSRVSRAGSSLMHHISYILIKNGFQFEKDYQREYKIEESCKLDFFFPNLETYNNEPKNCCSVACQTTSNDRYRMTWPQMPPDTRNRACTAIGCPNFSKKLGSDSLTLDKLKDAKKHGVKFVVLEKGIDQRLRDSQAVMSYNEWFKELKAIKPFWR